MISEIAFGLLSALAIISALMMLLEKNSGKSLLYLVLTFVSMGGVYLIYGADFIAAIHILIYAGTIAAMLAFVIMMIGEEVIPSRRSLAAIALAVIIAGFSAYLARAPGSGSFSSYTVWQIGGEMLTTYMVPFELISLVLLIAIIAAIYLVREGERG